VVDALPFRHHNGLSERLIVEELKILIQVPMRVVLYPSADDPKMWIAHALDFDILGHGTSRKAAVIMLNEALAETVLFRIQNNLPPIELAPAPEEVWKLAFKAGLTRRSPGPLKDAKVSIGRPSQPKNQIVVSNKAPVFAHAC
jgi:hypothetical protein